MALQQEQKQVESNVIEQRQSYQYQEKVIGDLTQYQAAEPCFFCNIPIRKGKYTDKVIERIPVYYNSEFNMYIATEGKDDIIWYHKNCEVLISMHDCLKQV